MKELGIIFDITVSPREKLIRRMRNNPRGWRIEDLKALAVYYQMSYDQVGSQVTFALQIEAESPFRRTNPSSRST